MRGPKAKRPETLQVTPTRAGGAAERRDPPPHRGPGVRGARLGPGSAMLALRTGPPLRAGPPLEMLFCRVGSHLNGLDSNSCVFEPYPI